MNIVPFTAAISEAILEDLRSRLKHTRWSDALDNVGWQQGTDPVFLRRLCDFWEREYDWRKDEARLNALSQYRAVDQDGGLHFVHFPSQSPEAIPLLITNGWPSSIFEYLEVIPMLAAAGFHVVAPTLPGYGFSDKSTRPGMNVRRIADRFSNLMTSLGYDRFMAHGSDVGMGVVEQIRRYAPERLIAAHFSNLYWMGAVPEHPTQAELAYLSEVDQWMKTESAYVQLQRTKPQTISFGLNDSPVGMAAWIIEKFHAWTDGDPEEVYGLAGLCANLTLYWATETASSAARQYAEHMIDEPEAIGAGDVPVGVVVFPGEHMGVPRELAERWCNLAHFGAPERGGHFAAWEVPELFVEELKAFRSTLAL